MGSPPAPPVTMGLGVRSSVSGKLLESQWSELFEEFLLCPGLQGGTTEGVQLWFLAPRTKPF